MAEAAPSFPVGQAPWETAPKHVPNFPVGQAPWETAPKESSGNSFLDQHPTILKAVKGGIEDLPLAGAITGGVVGEAAGIAAAPITAGASIVGGAVGAGVGGATGSALKDTLNNWIFGKEKSAGEIAQGAALEGAETAVVQLVGGTLFKGAGKVASSWAEKVIPVAVLDRYREAADAVKSLVSNSKGDQAEAAAGIKSVYQESLQEFRTRANQQISTSLESNESTVSAEPIIKKLTELQGRYTIEQNMPLKAQLQQEIESLSKMSGAEGEIPLKKAYELQRYFQNAATSAYQNAGESKTGTELANLLKQVAAVTRKGVNEAAPELAEANTKLSALHEIEDTMNKSLIRSGKSSAALIKAGSYKPGYGQGNADYAKALRDLGNLLGKDFIGPAQDLAAMNAFQKGSLFKTGAGAAGGAAIGAGAAELSGSNPYQGAMIGGALGGAITSPYAIKTALDVGKMLPQETSAVVGQTLGQAVMHGTGASRALKQIGEGQ